MELTWMGRYRELVRALVVYANLSSRYTMERITQYNGVSLSQSEYQTLEYILEYENEIKIMSDISKELGIKPSTLTKITKHLLEEKLVERYHIKGNKKNIVLKPTEKGRETYISYCHSGVSGCFKKFFNVLDNFSDEQLKLFENALWQLSKDWSGLTDSSLLEKIEDKSTKNC